jgi:hypothetical protein
MACTARASNFGKGKKFSLLQTVSGAYLASYFFGNQSSFLGVKLPKHEMDYSPPPTAEVNISGTVTLLPPNMS